MQTFLPYPSFTDSAAVLDNRRLGKQRVEALQILRAICDPSYGWQNHPAVRMWRPHSSVLWLYGIGICDEWRRRGFRDSVRDTLVSMRPGFGAGYTWPAFLGDTGFHRSHQSNLVRKDPVFYRPRFPGVPDDLPYVWPV